MTSLLSDGPGSNSGQDVEPGSYTALRLQHASAEHIHLTTRRCFVGPIPEGWLKSHRKSWYKRYLTLSDYSSRTATFSARPGVSHQRQITGLDGPSASAIFGSSFPQPEDVDEDPEDDAGDNREEAEEGHGKKGDEDEGEVSDLEPQSTAKDGVEGGPEEISPNDDGTPGPKAKRRPTFEDRLSPKASTQTYSTTSFVTAPTKPRKPFQSRLESVDSAKSPQPSSFVTAKEGFTGTTGEAGTSILLEPAEASIPNSVKAVDDTSDPLASGNLPRSSTGDMAVQENNVDSTTHLLPHGNVGTAAASPIIPPKDSGPDHNVTQPQAISHGMVRFNLSDRPPRDEASTRATVRQSGRLTSWRRSRQGSSHPGEIVKVEKMLVRVDSTMQELPSDYNENDSLKTSSRTVEKWRELVVVCRESTTEDVDFTIQMYKTRVIPSKENNQVKKRCTHEIPLARTATHVNLYSSLDKTLVIWVPWKMGTMMYILRTHSIASAVEWYTFLRRSLGSHRTNVLQVNVPDLSVTLQVDNPFGELEASMSAVQAVKADDAAIQKTMEAERAVASTIIHRSLRMLENNPEWANVLEAWLAKERMGLAWKRYDRLEWIHGANEQRMYGTMAMQQTHELELRPKEHYPTSSKAKGETMDEPAPVEGFLIRLTSQKGHVRRLGKMYFKRLYFTVHNQYLCYCRPAKALPPPPPRYFLKDNVSVLSASEIVENTPLIYAVNPFPNKDGEIEWLHQGTPASKARHDADAYKEAERKVNSMLEAEGYVNLSHVVRVQNAQRGNSPADANVDQGPDVDFHEDVEDTGIDDGQTDQFDDKRTFELVMKNKLVIRLQAYNEITKKEWMARLRNLVRYWKLRLANDMDILKAVRGLNLKHLEIDEESEAYIGQFGSKWEVTRSVASPELFNMCGISCCRVITMSGTLYRKPKRHSTFQRCGVILCHGQLLIFHGTLREISGKEVAHIQHERQAAIHLKNCYIYSGLVTEGDLLYQNRTFDSNHPGHHALPRVYLEDGWTSIDEDTMTCFVVWQPQNKSLFKANEEQSSGRTRQRLRYVSRLGVPGRSIVFKARSRAERDHWVMSIGMEIDRLQAGQDIRVVDKKV